MKEKTELVLETLIDWIDDDDNPVEGLTSEQLKQRTGLSPSEIKKVVKGLYEERCLILMYSSKKTPLDFHEVSISAEGVKKYATLLAKREAEDQKELIFEQLLHPNIIQSSYKQFRNGHLRDAVLNAIIAVFDAIREKTGLKDLDGDALVTKVFSERDPLLILSDLSTSSGKNDQVGFMQLLQGTYKGIRNPKAHSLSHDLDVIKTRQYLIFASLLCRRIEESVKV